MKESQEFKRQIGRQYKHAIGCYITDEMKDDLDAYAAQHGVGVSTLLRQIIAEKLEYSKVLEEFSDL